MKTILALSSALLLAATASFAMPAQAQSRGSDHSYSRSHQQDHDDRRAPDSRFDDRRDDRRYEARRGYTHNPRYDAPRQYTSSQRYVAPRGYRANRWNPGSRLPSGYYGNSYYVDHARYGLRTPPRGQRWVRVDRDVYLVSIASGVISNVLFGLFR